jgi:hypothetical protein
MDHSALKPGVAMSIHAVRPLGECILCVDLVPAPSADLAFVRTGDARFTTPPVSCPSTRGVQWGRAVCNGQRNTRCHPLCLAVAVATAMITLTPLQRPRPGSAHRCGHATGASMLCCSASNEIAIGCQTNWLICQLALPGHVPSQHSVVFMYVSVDMV